MRPLFSVVSIWNDSTVLEDILLPSIRRQSVSVELLLFDNRAGTFSSCAAGLNYCGEKAVGEYIAFVHQDVAFPDPEYLAKAADILQKLPDCGVAGPVGTLRRLRGRALRHMRGGIFSGHMPGTYQAFGCIKQSLSVYSLDECLLIVPRRVFLETRFDSIACPGWHLYGVDYSIMLRDRGLRSYVIPLPAYHMSGGRLDKSYFHTLELLIKKHRRHLLLATTCGNWLTLIPVSYQRAVKRYLGGRA